MLFKFHPVIAFKSLFIFQSAFVQKFLATVETTERKLIYRFFSIETRALVRNKNVMRYFSAEQLRQTTRKISSGEGICVDIQVTINVFLIQLSSKLLLTFFFSFSSYCLSSSPIRSCTKTT